MQVGSASQRLVSLALTPAVRGVSDKFETVGGSVTLGVSEDATIEKVLSTRILV